MQAAQSSIDLNATAQASKGTNVQVVVRCRPLNAEEKKSAQPSVITCDVENKLVKVAYGPAGKKIMKSFTFDKVFGTYSRQEEVFESTVRPIVEETLAGFNCTIFAYGQTGTGKTHTMEGDIHSKDEAGIVPRAVNFILEQLESSGLEFTIRVSFLELYNEELQDLLNVTGEKKLKLCEDTKKGGVVCQNLEEIAVLNANDIFEILQRGIMQRQTAATLCNKNSSRSHSIFTLKIMIKEYNVEGEEVVRHGQLNLVDLAGSECIARSGAKNDRAREAGSINQSLLTLGRVITALVDHHQHVPYRDSKLTRLLQESLGGKAKTCIIATLSPSQSAVEETMSTLDYAHRAKNIKNQPTVNQKLTKKVIMKEYFAEIETLRNQLMMTREKNGVYVDPAEYYAMESKIANQESQLNECEAALRSRNEEFRAIKTDYDVLEGKYEVVSQELDSVSQELCIVKEEKEKAREDLTIAVMEWKACEEVMKEHKYNETVLLQESSKVYHEYQIRQGEVNTLVEKVENLYGTEAMRMQNMSSFVTTLNGMHDTMNHQMNTLTTCTTQDAQELTHGIVKMLENSRVTCQTLQDALQTALKILLDGTVIAKDTMLHNCHHITEQLSSDKEVLVERLQNAQKQLDVWLQSSSASLVMTQGLVSQQMKKMHEFQMMLSTQQQSMVSQALNYESSQTQLSEQLMKGIQDWQHMSMQRLEGFKVQTIRNQQIANNALQTKAKEMEKVFATILQELVSHNTSVCMQTQQEVNTYCEEMLNDQAQKVTVLSNLASKTLLKNAANYTTEVNNQSAENLKVMTENFTVLLETEEMVVQQVQAMDHSLGSKRKLVSEEYTNYMNAVETTAKRACSEVTQVSNMAEEVLTQVNESSKQMNASASHATQQFVAYVDKEGETLRTGIHQHFEHTKQKYITQKQMVEKANSSVEKYQKDMLTTTTSVSGSTPKKATRALQPIFPRTRAHHVIKREAKTTAPLNVLNYEHAALQLEDVKNNVVEDEMEVAEPLTAMASEQQPSVVVSVTNTAAVPVVTEPIRVGNVKTIEYDGEMTPLVPAAAMNEAEIENVMPNAANIGTRRTRSNSKTNTGGGVSKTRGSNSSTSTTGSSGNAIEG